MLSGKSHYVRFPWSFFSLSRHQSLVRILIIYVTCKINGSDGEIIIHRFHCILHLFCWSIASKNIHSIEPSAFAVVSLRSDKTQSHQVRQKMYYIFLCFYPPIHDSPYNWASTRLILFSSPDTTSEYWTHSDGTFVTPTFTRRAGGRCTRPLESSL